MAKNSAFNLLSKIKTNARDKVDWSFIRSEYRGKWVELVDFEWNWKHPFPERATIRHSSYDRLELSAMIRKSGEVAGSAILYVGEIGTSIDFPEQTLTA